MHVPRNFNFTGLFTLISRNQADFADQVILVFVCITTALSLSLLILSKPSGAFLA